MLNIRWLISFNKQRQQYRCFLVLLPYFFVIFVLPLFVLPRFVLPSFVLPRFRLNVERFVPPPFGVTVTSFGEYGFSLSCSFASKLSGLIIRNGSVSSTGDDGFHRQINIVLF